MVIDRVFALSNSAPVISHTAGTNDDYNGQKNSLNLNWNFVKGAESFDLEWLYVNTGDKDHNSSDFVIDF